MIRPSLDRLGGWMHDEPGEDEDNVDELLAELEETEEEACLGHETKAALQVPSASLPVYMTIHR